MSDDPRRDSVDFFEFLSGVWRDRWAFLIIVVVTTLVAGGLVISLQDDETPTIKTADPLGTRAVIPMRVFSAGDPYSRSLEELWQDLYVRLRMRDKLNFVYEGEVLEDMGPRERSYSVKLNSHIAFVHIYSKLGGERAIQDFSNILQAAAEEQIVDTLARVRSDIDLINKLANNGYNKSGDFLTDKLYRYIHFVNSPSIAARTYRFFDVGPISIMGSPNAARVKRSGWTKVFVLATAGGFVLASFFVVARLARRKRENLTSGQRVEADGARETGTESDPSGS